MALRLLCNRPIFHGLDLQSARFVVAKACGITIDGKWYGMGEEVPPGALTPYALECEYERPLARIDELTYALTIDGLREACEAHGVTLKKVPKVPTVVMPDLSLLDRQELSNLCAVYGLDSEGTVKQLRQRLSRYLGL
jgi:hypothetical protein